MINFEEMSDTWWDRSLEERQEIEKAVTEPHDLFILNSLHSLRDPDDSSDLIGAATHDKIFFSTSIEDFNRAATEELAETFCALGVFVDEDSLAMFV